MKYLHRFFCWLGLHDSAPIHLLDGVEHRCLNCWALIKGEGWERP